MSQPRKVTLSNIAGGRAEQQFQRELARLSANVEDPNTKPEAARKIVVTLTFKPGADRENGIVVSDVTSKLAAAQPHASQVYFGKVRGEPVVTSNDVTQEDAFDSAGITTDAPPAAPILFGARAVAGAATTTEH